MFFSEGPILLGWCADSKQNNRCLPVPRLQWKRSGKIVTFSPTTLSLLRIIICSNSTFIRIVENNVNWHVCFTYRVCFRWGVALDNIHLQFLARVWNSSVAAWGWRRKVFCVITFGGALKYSSLPTLNAEFNAHKVFMLMLTSLFWDYINALKASNWCYKKNLIYKIRDFQTF